MGCGKGSLKHGCLTNIPESVSLNIDINIKSYHTYEYNYLTYCIKCDVLGLNKKTIHCDACDRCHNILKYLHCTVCNICVNPSCDHDYIRHRKLHNNL